jgi:hypothetical protein
MLEKRKVLRLKKGDVFRWQIADGLYGYAQYIEPTLTVFFSKYSTEPLEAKDLIDLPAAFKLCVYKSAFKDENNEKIGNIAVLAENAVKPTTFKQDIISGGLFIYDESGHPNNIWRPASYEECKNIETTSVWEFGHVRRRLLELYDGKPNRWLGKHVIDKEKLAKYLEQQKQ